MTAIGRKMTVRIAFIFFVVLISGCASVIEVNIAKNEVYEYNFGFLDDEQGLDFTRQAENHAVSEIIWNEQSQERIFRYQPEDKFIGKDVVEIRFTEWDYEKEKEITHERYRFKFNISE